MIWIKTSEKLPELEHSVLVTRQDKNKIWETHIAFLFVRYDNLWWESNDMHYDLSRFSYWMPLPSNPLDQKSIL